MTGSKLKIIAIITMLIDHVGFGIVWRLPSIESSSIIYVAMRLIGRLAFPIFIFLLIEGFGHTRSKLKYALRMLMFCFISEIPFDLAFWGNILEIQHQNVYFTLFIGLLVIWGMDEVQKQFLVDEDSSKELVYLYDALIIIAGGGVATALCTDYSYIGILAIVVMYLFRKNRVLQALLGCMVLTVLNPTEFTCFAIVPLIAMYNGKRGIGLKYLFYIFYPAHLFIIYLIAAFMGYNIWLF